MDSETPCSVLIVDDNTKNLQILADILRSRDYKIAMAKDGVSALKFVSRRKPDMVLLDIMMPEMDGFEVCRRLKSDRETADIPVIFISALNDTEDKLKAFRAGGVDYITKPFRKEEVFARVNVHLELKRSYKELEKINETLNIEVRERKQAEKAARKAHQEITDSIQYAQMIQASLLPNPDFMKSYLPDSFSIYMPKALVGGDIFFTEFYEEGFIAAVLDCTGHGVPGAFMTMIVFSALKRIITDEKCREPVQILKRLNFIVKTTLHQDTPYAVSDDGLDAAVCFVQPKAGILNFAGAKLPLFCTFDRDVIQIKGDRQSLGYRRSDLNFDFTPHILHIQKGMNFYMASDGFEDQMGERKDRGGYFKISRFGRKDFMTLLGNISSLAFEQQKGCLLDTFFSYKGKLERQDDMTIVGFSPPIPESVPESGEDC